MAEDSDREIGKLRRFALSVGLVLFTVAIAGVELESPAILHPLGIPLHVKRPDVLGIGLCIASVYALIRYWLYAFVLTVSPIRMRRRIKRGESLGRLDPSPTIFTDQATHLVGRYFPSVGRKKTQFKVGPYDTPIQDLRIPLRAHVLTWIENLDYLAPALVNIIALLTYLTYAGVFAHVYVAARHVLGH